MVARQGKRRERRVQRLLERDGRRCWLCDRPILAGEETIEHLKAKAAVGTDNLENLVLCHSGCNAHLKDRPVARKLRMRVKWHHEAARRARVDLTGHSEIVRS